MTASDNRGGGSMSRDYASIVGRPALALQAARRAACRHEAAAPAHSGPRARPAAEQARGQEQDGAQQLEHTLHGNAKHPKRQQKQPHEGLEHEHQQRESGQHRMKRMSHNSSLIMGGRTQLRVNWLQTRKPSIAGRLAGRWRPSAARRLKARSRAVTARSQSPGDRGL